MPGDGDIERGNEISRAALAAPHSAASGLFTTFNAAPLPPPPDGFAGAASWMAADRDGEALIFRRFGTLAARNLLYLQAEVLALEKRLARLDATVATQGDMQVRDAARTWEVLVEQCEDGVGAEEEDVRAEAVRLQARERMEIILALRSRTKEYRTFLQGS